MSVNVRIKQEKKIFKKPIDIFKMCELWQETCVNKDDSNCLPMVGVQDGYFRIISEFFVQNHENRAKRLNILSQSRNFVLFDRNNLNRGISLCFDGYDILLKLNYPSTLSEIKSFYSLIQKVCKNIDKDTFYRDDKDGYHLVNLNELDQFVKGDYLFSYDLLKQSLNNKTICIFCVVNPVRMSSKELESIGLGQTNNDSNETVDLVMNNYEHYLNELQSKNLYYATFSCYRKNEDIVFGILPLPTDCETIIPLNPADEFTLFKSANPSLFNCDRINEFYMGISYNDTFYQIKYSDFISDINNQKLNYYDATHIIVKYDNSKIKDLVEKYGISIDDFNNQN